MKLKAWLNGLGYDFGKWELVKREDGVWFAAHKPSLYADKIGTGRTYDEAIMNARKVTNETN